jgi:hypothetical protein
MKFLVILQMFVLLSMFNSNKYLLQIRFTLKIEYVSLMKNKLIKSLISISLLQVNR